MVYIRKINSRISLEMISILKSFFSSSKLTIALIILSGLIGFYLGWHLHNEKTAAGALDTINKVRKIENETVKSSVVASETTANKIQNETRRHQEIKREIKRVEIVDQNVLDIRLPDDTLSLLYSASGGQGTTRSPR